MMADIKKLEVPVSLSRLGEVFKDAGHELYLVGGVVRGALLLGSDMDTATEAQINRQDADAATDAHPARIKALLGPHAENLWTVGERFGTIAATIGEYEVQITTYRTDQYTQGSRQDRKSTRLNSSHANISYAVFCLKRKTRRDGATQYLPKIAVTPNGRLDVVYYDRRRAARDWTKDVSLKSSFDRGENSSLHVRLSD